MTATTPLPAEYLQGIVAQTRELDKSSKEIESMTQKFDETAQENEKLGPRIEELTQQFEAFAAQVKDDYAERESKLEACTQEYNKKTQEIFNIYDDKVRGYPTIINGIQKQYTELKDRIQQLSKASPINTPTYQHPITYITVKYAAGYGNSLSICGTGPQMDWDAQKAVPLRCVGDDTWVYETNADFEAFNFKILLKKGAALHWEEGSDHVVRRDTPQQITPRFAL